MKLAIATAFVVFAASAGIEAAQADRRKVQVPNRYDGRWSIEVVTLEGPCDRAYRYGVQIERGEAFYAGGEFSINGRVTADGSVRAVISRGNDSARVAGRLQRGGTGGGTWMTAGGGPIACSGQWNAVRRG